MHDEQLFVGEGVGEVDDVLGGDVGVADEVVVTLGLDDEGLHLLDVVVQLGLLLGQLLLLPLQDVQALHRLVLFQGAHPLDLVLHHLLDVADALQHVGNVVDTPFGHPQLLLSHVQVDPLVLPPPYQVYELLRQQRQRVVSPLAPLHLLSSFFHALRIFSS